MSRVTIAQAIGDRQRQEDAALVARVGGHVVAVLSDGMGGHRLGAEAAQAATSAALGHIQRRRRMLVDLHPEKACRLLRGAVQDAVEAVGHLGRGYRAPGCTLIVAVCSSHEAFIAHVGDSRVWWRDGMWPARLLVQPHGHGHRLLSHIPEVRLLSHIPEVRQMDLVHLRPEGGGWLVLASDGVDDPGDDAAEIVKRQLALARRGQDNATAIVIQMQTWAPTWEIAPPVTLSPTPLEA